eukprot:780135-Pleurochrysis_carterae.AAC.2
MQIVRFSRRQARMRRDFGKADQIREELFKLGVEIWESKVCFRNPEMERLRVTRVRDMRPTRSTATRTTHGMHATLVDTHAHDPRTLTHPLLRPSA